MKKVFLPTIFFFILFISHSSLQAGSSSSKLIIEEEIKKNISHPIAPIHQANNIIKTKSKKPDGPKQQIATKCEVNAKPVEEICGNEEIVFKKIDPDKDGRKKVEQTDKWPNSVHGVVYVCFPSGSYGHGTGTLISPNIVLTAAHNLYNHGRSGGKATNVRFLPAMNGQSLPFDEPIVIDFYFPKAYRLNKTEDFGILVLKTPIWEQTGYFGMAILPPEQLKTLEINVTGYPWDKVKDKPKPQPYEMWGMKGNPIEVTNNEIKYQIDTFNGQSGSGVWYKDENDDYFVVGVHVHGDEGLQRNSATLLTETRYNKINKWVKKSICKNPSIPLSEVDIERVQKINLYQQYIRESGMRELVGYKLPHLTELNLKDNNIKDEGSTIIAQYFANLKVLNLAGNMIGDEGIEEISISKKLSNLTVLNLANNFIRCKGAKALSQANFAFSLTFIDLSRNQIRDEGMEALCQGRLTNLTSLNLEDNDIRKETGVKALSQANFTSLRVLNVKELERLPLGLGNIDSKDAEIIKKNFPKLEDFRYD